MGWTFCESKHITKTRKPHKCIFCRRIIPAGSPKIFNWHGLYESDFQNSYACHWCEDHQDRLVDDWDNEILDFWDCIREDLFQDKIEELKKMDIDLKMELEGDYLVFYTYDKKELHREYMPIIREEIKEV